MNVVLGDVKRFVVSCDCLFEQKLSHNKHLIRNSVFYLDSSADIPAEVKGNMSAPEMKRKKKLLF